MVPAIGLASCIFFFPESPRWLIDHDRHEEGLRNLATLHANGNVNDPYVLAEFELIKQQIEEEHQHGAKSYKDLFSNRSNTRRIIIACACQASSQMYAMIPI